MSAHLFMCYFGTLIFSFILHCVVFIVALRGGWPFILITLSLLLINLAQIILLYLYNKKFNFIFLKIVGIISILPPILIFTFQMLTKVKTVEEAIGGVFAYLYFYIPSYFLNALYLILFVIFFCNEWKVRRDRINNGEENQQIDQMIENQD